MSNSKPASLPIAIPMAHSAARLAARYAQMNEGDLTPSNPSRLSGSYLELSPGKFSAASVQVISVLTQRQIAARNLRHPVAVAPSTLSIQEHGDILHQCQQTLSAFNQEGFCSSVQGVIDAFLNNPAEPFNLLNIQYHESERDYGFQKSLQKLYQDIFPKLPVHIQSILNELNELTDRKPFPKSLSIDVIAKIEAIQIKIAEQPTLKALDQEIQALEQVRISQNDTPQKIKDFLDTIDLLVAQKASLIADLERKDQLLNALTIFSALSAKVFEILPDLIKSKANDMARDMQAAKEQQAATLFLTRRMGAALVSGDFVDALKKQVATHVFSK